MWKVNARPQINGEGEEKMIYWIVSGVRDRQNWRREFAASRSNCGSQGWGGKLGCHQVNVSDPSKGIGITRGLEVDQGTRMAQDAKGMGPLIAVALDICSQHMPNGDKIEKFALLRNKGNDAIGVGQSSKRKREGGGSRKEGAPLTSCLPSRPCTGRVQSRSGWQKHFSTADL